VICANQIPDHATIARFRVRHETALADLFGQVLGLCAASSSGRDRAAVAVGAASPSKLVGYAGLAPRISQSGERSSTGRLSKAGSRTLRRAAVEAGNQAWRPSNPFHEYRLAERHSKSPAKSSVADPPRLTVLGASGDAAGVEDPPHRVLRNWPLGVLPLVALARHCEVRVHTRSVAVPARRDAASAVVRQPPAGLRWIANRGAPQSGQ